MKKKPHDFKPGDQVVYTGRNPGLVGMKGTVSFAEPHNIIIQAVTIEWDSGEKSTVPSSSITLSS